MISFFVFLGGVSLGFIIGAGWRAAFEPYHEPLDITPAQRRRRRLP